MKGKHQVEVRNRDVVYKFEINRNITIVRGDSGTGKTTLYEMILNHTRFAIGSGVNIVCDKKCIAFLYEDWESYLRRMNDCIIFFDENQHFIYTKEFARAIKETSNYYVLITREELYKLPYSVDEIYEIKESGKYHTLKRMYEHNKKHVYFQGRPGSEKKFSVLLTEDAKSGFQFYSHYFEEKGIQCFSSGSNSAIYGWLEDHKDERVFVIADGAAFGAEMNRVIDVCRASGSILCLPESFEWLILKSGLVKIRGLKDILEDPSKYIDSSLYFSWENFFETLLKDETAGTPFQYSKKEINPVYLISENAKRIIGEVL